MTILAIRKVGGICPAGTLEEILFRLKNGSPIDQREFMGECDSSRLKELASLLPGSNLRRTPRLARIALRAALEAADSPLNTNALIISTAYGSVTSTFEFLDSIMHDGADMASPTAFSHSVTNMTAAYVSQYLGPTGPCLTVTQPSLKSSLEAARALLVSGQVDGVVWGVVSERSEIMEEIERRSGRPQLSLTDGAVFFRLTLPDPAKNEPLIEIDEERPTGSDEYGMVENTADFFGSGPLALALRLALTCLFLSEGSAGELPMACLVGEDPDLFVVKSGGSAAWPA